MFKVEQHLSFTTDTSAQAHWDALPTGAKKGQKPKPQAPIPTA